MDQDLDGFGEYGWLQELAGVSPLRQVLGSPSGQPLQLPHLPSPLGLAAQAGGGIATLGDYYYLLYLPRAQAPAARETAPPEPLTSAAVNSQERRYACYAWPALEGLRAFVVNQQGEVYGAQEHPYVGPEAIPPPGNAIR